MVYCYKEKAPQPKKSARGLSSCIYLYQLGFLQDLLHLLLLRLCQRQQGLTGRAALVPQAVAGVFQRRHAQLTRTQAFTGNIRL